MSKTETENGAKVALPKGPIAIPTLLGRTLGLAALGLKPSLSAVVPVLDILVDIDVYGLEERLDAETVQTLIESSAAIGEPLVFAPCAGEGFAGLVLILETPRAKELPLNDGQDHKYLTDVAPQVKPDMTVMEAFSRVTGLRAHYCYGGSYMCPPFPYETGRLNVFMSGRPPGLPRLDEFRIPIRKLFGTEFWSTGETRYVAPPTYGRGRLVEGEGIPLFQMVGNNAYSIPPLIGNKDIQNAAGREKIVRGLLGVLARDLVRNDPTTEPDLPPPPDRASAERFAEELAARRAAVKRDEVTRIDREIGDLQSKITGKLRERRNALALFKAVESDGAAMRDRIADDVEQLAASPDITGIRLDPEEGLTAETVPIAITHGGIRHDLGPFRIQIAPNGGIEVWSERPRHPKGHHHPHIDRTSLTCYGNVTLALAKLAGDHRYADAVVLILRWLRTYTPETSLIPLEEFPTAAPGPEGGER